MAEPPRQPVLPEFATIPMWREVSGMTRTRTYEELAAGNLRGVKCGRVVLIDVKYGLEWLRSLPSVQIRPRMTPRRRSAPPVSSVQAEPRTDQADARALEANSSGLATSGRPE